MDCITHLQSFVRSLLARRQLTELEQEKHTLDCIVQIQAHWRGALAQYELDDLIVEQYENESALIIQSWWRMMQAKKKFTYMKNVVKCQSIIRMWLACRQAQRLFAERTRRHELILMSKLTIAQCYIRGQLVRHQAHHQSQRVINLQNLIRSKSIITNHQNQLRYIRTIQSLARGRSATICASDRYRMNLIRNQSCIKMQKVFRGFMVRKKNHQQVSLIRARIAQLASTMEEKKQLSYRTKRALHLLSTSEHMSQVIQACQNLAVTTKYSSNCCESLVRHKAVPVLYKVVDECNRSKPALELMNNVLDILINLSKTRYTSHDVFIPSCLHTFVLLLGALGDQCFMKVIGLMQMMKLQYNQLYWSEMMLNQGLLFKKLSKMQSVLKNKLEIEKKKEIQTRRASVYVRDFQLNHSLNASTNSSGRSCVYVFYDALCNLLNFES
ncbi:hypothetical protein AKO1_013342 [Acrasis kona]|uniref:Uncharacterized protein n=1 Tax=Acrasis kona TaxID=1008807 RepID=A0AAW2YYS4_9EUKA